MSKIFNSYSLPIIELQTARQTQQQIREFAETYDSINSNYEQLEPLRPKNPPLFSKTFNNCQAVESALHKIEGKNQASINAQAEKIFARMSKEMRQDSEKMLTMIQRHPRTILFAAPEILTKDFVLKAMAKNPKVYDVLPPEWQKDKDLALQYAKAALNNAEYHNIGKDEHGRSLGAHLPALNPNCPLESIADELYKGAAKTVLERGSGLTKNTIEESHVIMGAHFATMVLLQNRVPELQERIPQLEKEMLLEHKDALFSKALIPIDQSDWLFELCEKHNMPDYAQEYCEAAWKNKCVSMMRAAQYDIGKLGDFPKELQDCPKHILAQYVDPKTFKPNPDDSLLLAAKTMAKEAAQLAEQDRLSLNVYKGLRVFQMSEISVVKENFDFEAVVKQTAERASFCQAGELWSAPEPISGKYPPQYPSYLGQMNAQTAHCKAMEDFIATSPRLSELYHSELQRLQTERQNWTPQEQEWHRLQQLTYQKVQGDKQLDYEIIQCIKNNPNGEYSKHLDVADYLNRRADHLFSNMFGNQAEIQAFQHYLADCPEAKALITSVEAKHLENPFKFDYGQQKSTISQDVSDYLHNKTQEITSLEAEFGLEPDMSGRSRE